MANWKVVGKLKINPNLITSYTILGPLGKPEYVYFLDNGDKSKLRVAESTADFEVGDEIEDSMIKGIAKK